MPNGENYTVYEHFISRMYLKEFADIRESGHKEKAFLWQFNVKTMEPTPVQVNVNSICYEKNLYELRNEDGTFIGRNTIEMAFAGIESGVSKAIKSIKCRIQNEKCINCTTFLTDEEKSMLIILITTLMYRDPYTIERGISFLKENNPELSATQARNFTLLNLLPIGQDVNWNQNTIISTAIADLSEMAFQVGVTTGDVIFTSDRPFVEWFSHDPTQPNKLKSLVFPLTSNIVVYLYPKEDVDSIVWNYSFRLDEERVRDIQFNTAVCAREWIYTKEKLTVEQLELITKARNRLK